jgi:hypothetical protein
MKTATPDFRIVKAFKCLFDDQYRYKVFYGGRGSGKSWQIARYVLYKMWTKKTRVLCCREIQQSLEESVHHLLASQIEMLNLSKYFTVTNKSIICNHTGSDAIFAGLLRNINKIKSLDAIEICWCEEAEACSEESLQVLFPTVFREKNSEVIISFNSRYVDDAVYQRFVINSTPEAVVKFVNWQDNTHFPAALAKEKDNDYALRPTEAKTIWGGEITGLGRHVWPEFNENVHVRDFDMNMIANTANCFMGMDPASKYYPACVFLAIFPKNARKRWPDDFILYAYSEYPTVDDLGSYFHKIRTQLLYTGTLKDMAKNIYIAEGLNTYGIKIIKRGCDTRFAKGAGGTNMFSNQSQGLVSEWAKPENGGLIFNLPNEKCIDVQRQNIIKDLQYNTLLPVSPTNEPRLFISARCKNLIASLKNHRCEENTEKENAKYKDFSDCARILYATIDNFEYQDPRLMVMDGANKFTDPQYQTLNTPDNQSWMGA